MTRKFLLSTLSTAAMGLSVLALPGVAQAQMDDTDYCVDYETIYEDQGLFEDDVLDNDEYDGLTDTWFDDWDVDDSGDISEEEFATCYDSIGWDAGDGAFDNWDADSSGTLDDEEFFNEDAYDEWDLDDTDEVDQNEWF